MSSTMSFRHSPSPSHHNDHRDRQDSYVLSDCSDSESESTSTPASPVTSTSTLTSSSRCPSPSPDLSQHPHPPASSSSTSSSTSKSDPNPDDFYRNGVPVSPFHLSPSHSLSSLLSSHSHIDPFTIISDDLKNVSQSIRDVLGSDHPTLHMVAKYFFETTGKQFRPAILFLMAHALRTSSSSDISHPSSSDISSSQRRFIDIIEIIHTASLLHDDVLDHADTRRGVPSVNKVFGNKLAILGGDFLLCRAYCSVARLRNPDVMELATMCMEHLVKGEIIQMKPGKAPTLDGNLNIYITKSYYKTASLIASGCKGIAILGGYDEHTISIAYEYGKNVGLAFQIIDDIIDFTSTSEEMGKPALNDMTNGIITAPLLYALHDYPQLQILIDRKFKQEGDVEMALDYLTKSNGIARARALAISCCENAIAAILNLHPSPYQSALIHLVDRVLNRAK